jgi:hypothetical protein
LPALSRKVFIGMRRKNDHLMRQDRESAVKVIFVGWVEKLRLFFRYRFFLFLIIQLKTASLVIDQFFKAKLSLLLKIRKEKRNCFHLKKDIYSMPSITVCLVTHYYCSYNKCKNVSKCFLVSNCCAFRQWETTKH